MEETMDVRIGKYLSGEMTGHEREAFEHEMTQAPGLRSQVESGSRMWYMSSNDLVQGSWDTDAAWARFSTQNNTIPIPRQFKLNRAASWAIAASAVMLAGIYSLFFYKGSPVTYAYNAGAIEPIALKDGSKIHLNKDAEVVVYPFTSKKRHVELKGEAFFEITSDPSKPFTVSSGETVTEVVGTSFNIRHSADQTLIFVNSGKVIFSSSTDTQQAAALTEGEAAVFKNGTVDLIPNPSPNINAWRTQNLRFVSMPLSSVIDDISRYFDQEIVIENEASKSCTVNIPFVRKPELKAVLSAVAFIINAELIEEGNTFIIRGGDNCN